jgi:ketosteroid isomerase-like protein
VSATEVVRRNFDNVTSGDIDAALAGLDPDVEIEDNDLLDAGHYRGHEEYLRWLEQWNESFGTWRVEDSEYVEAADGQVVMLFTMIATGRGSGIEMRRADAILCQVRAGKIVRIVYYNDQAAALDAAGARRT